MPKKPTLQASPESFPTLRPSSSKRFHQLLASSEVMERYFRDHVRTFFPGSRSLIDSSYTHRPALSTQSYLTRFVLRTTDQRTAHVHHIRGNHVDRATYAIFSRLSSHPTNSVRFPRPLAYFSLPGYIFYQEVAGDTLRQLSLRSDRWRTVSTAIGQALAVFQKIPTRSIRPLRWAEETRWRNASLKTILRRAPRRAAWARQAVQTLTRLERSAWTSSPQGFVHKDFQASNIVLGKPIGLIDFTLSGRGPKAFDLGTYLMHLEVMSLGKISREEVVARQNAFLRGYQAQVTAAEWKALQSHIPRFQLRAAIDILAITLTYLGENDAQGRRYVDYIVHTIDRLIRNIAS